MRKTICLLFLFLWPVLSISSPAHTHDNNFLVLSDIHLDKQSNHSMEISPAGMSIYNDLDEPTFSQLISTIDQKIKQGIVEKPSFILLLGDLVGHIRSTPYSVIDSESLVFKTLKQTFSDTPILYVFGNNDSLNVNYGPFTTQNSRSPLTSPYEVAQTHGAWVDGFLSTGALCENKNNAFPCLMTKNKTHGYYSAYIKPKFKLIALNSVLFSLNRKNTEEKTAMDELAWLNEELSSSREEHDSVLIAMHIPPGANVYDHSLFWFPKVQGMYLQLIKQYSDILVGQLASHTHAEELKTVSDSSNQILSGVYFTPALSTSHGNESGIKTFYFTKKNEQWRLTDYQTFHFSMDDASLNLTQLYTFNAYYCQEKFQSDLTSCLHRITPVKMMKYFTAGNPYFPGIISSPNDMNLKIS